MRTVETVEKFELIWMLMDRLKNSDDNEEKKTLVKYCRDRGLITGEEAIDLYIEYEEYESKYNAE